MPLKVPASLTNTVEAHKKWLQILHRAHDLVKEDMNNQEQVAKGARIKERRLPPEVVGRCYAQYCALVNRMYDAYLNSVHLQRAEYILEIIAVFIKRMNELRDELVHIIVNDYIYVDSALAQLRMTPFDVQIVVPYHFPLECRKDNVEKVLQQMWTEAVKRKNKPPKKPRTPASHPHSGSLDDEEAPADEVSNEEDTNDENKSISMHNLKAKFQSMQHCAAQFRAKITRRFPSSRLSSVDDDDDGYKGIVHQRLDAAQLHMTLKPSVHTIIPEEYIHSNIIQRHERFRQWYLQDYKAKCNRRRMYFAEKGLEAPPELRDDASKLIQRVYRDFMKFKRKKLSENKRDVMLGLLPDPSRQCLRFHEENAKVYARRKNTRLKIQQTYLKELEKENMRLIIFKKENQIDDITEQIREWFKEWYHHYGFFPEYPYEVEGGTLLVIRGDYPSIEEKIIEDEKYLAATKGKTKEQLKQEKLQKALEQKMKAVAEKEKKKKEAEQLFKARCNPDADPGYKLYESDTMGQINEALQTYRLTWSLYDSYPPERFGETVYGFLKPLLAEDLMCTLHKDCRIYVDELMRLDLKLLIKQHQLMYKRLGMKYPKVKAKKMPKASPQPRTLTVDDALLKTLEPIFDLEIISKPTAKINDVYGDLSYGAYEYNIKDPDARYPLPAYGDIRRRLVLSCVFGSGIQPGSKRNKAIMLLGPARNGKSFLVDAVAGELNAIKIDISPECFTAVVDKPTKMLSQVLIVAKAFQPAVIYIRNVERIFYKKVPPEEKYLNAHKIKTLLAKFIRQISIDDKIILMATCTHPLAALRKPLVTIFDEIILVPRTDYGSLQRFFSEKLQSVRSMPLDYCVQAIAQLLQGYGFGIILEIYEAIMTPERIVRLNINPLSPVEFVNMLIERDYESVTLEDYQEYVKFFIENSPLNAERAEYEIINATRAEFYRKIAKKKV